MGRKFNQWITAAALVLGLAPIVTSDVSWASAAARMDGQVFKASVDEQTHAERATPRRVRPSEAVRHELRLGPLPDALAATKSAPVKDFGAPMIIGSHRELPAELRAELRARDLEWEPARGGGEAAAFTVTSPGAKALRLALDVERLPGGAELRFYSPSAPIAAAGAFEAAFVTSQRKAFADEPFWSPLVDGDTMVVEIWVPRWRPGAEVEIAVRTVSHIHHSLKDLDDIGRSGSCNRDAACYNKWTEAADAVAKIVFDTPFGTALCTGQLTANPDARFLFITAAHCVNTRSSANSVAFFWKFARSTCNGLDPTGVLQSGGGGKLLFTSRSRSAGLVTDHTLMELKRDPTAAAGALVGLGWIVGPDPEDNVRETVHGIHHPSGDLKKTSRGKVKETWQLQDDGGLSSADPPTHYEVQWKKGTTEGGSSGSPILVGKRWPEQFMIGVLTGGLASCQARRDPDFYGLFEETFRRYKKFRKHFE